MHFCKNCDNMYYIRLGGNIDEDGNESDNKNNLIYYCRKCGDENTMITKDNICVSKITLKRTEQKYTHLINKYTKLDPTLPRVTNIKCPNSECSTQENPETNEVITMRYDDINMKYVYLCVNCDNIWKLD
jgi:DNA-directed RNA polymerase subunit M/transcription elongation factor TFIIS